MEHMKRQVIALLGAVIVALGAGLTAIVLTGLLCLAVVGSMTFGVKLLRDGIGNCEGKSCVMVARTRIQIGDSRDKAIRSLPEAWAYRNCHDSTLFFFGPRDPDRVEIVEVSFRPALGGSVVDNVGSFDRYVYFDSLWGRETYLPCFPPELRK
jgi:hypothetical protein